jgi:hypothetical protein
MAGEDDKKKVEELSMRIKELEAQLSQLTAAAAPQDVSADEIRAYHKVRKSLGGGLAGWDQECGINECQPLRCIPGTSSGSYRRWRIQRCINECTCGPCNIDAIRESLEMTKLELEHITTVLRGGGGRFGGLG